MTAYYASWVQEAGVLTPQKIDYTAISHLVHFHVVPKEDGTIDTVEGITPAESEAVVKPAHAAGCKVLLCVGGGGTAARFRAAMAEQTRAVFIQNLIAMVRDRGYDGLDIDMEPVEDSDAVAYTAFIRELRAAMSARNPALLLTAAVASNPQVFAKLQSQFDQINLMTYDQAGLWDGFKTWHNSSLYDGGPKNRLTPERPYPSVQETVKTFVSAGISRAKLGIGIAFYGDIWSGADGPGQSIQGVGIASSEYHTIMDTYDRPDRRRWDAQAHAPYLSVSAPNVADRKFISFDDERLCGEKVNYAREQGLGGVILFELGSGYRDSQAEGKKDPLLQAVKRAWRGGR